MAFESTCAGDIELDGQIQYTGRPFGYAGRMQMVTVVTLLSSQKRERGERTSGLITMLQKFCHADASGQRSHNDGHH